ncbi:hypothetical protein BB560_001487 [Smittium megazygosporum]|uniref:RING-type E3 ubiquitin transferase n=1 Tax=Smittium megazygosporum TaxID=133381 RepID=A0A2T9ZHG7_9FUNG|nr:hypothetical protein BB560_001487 [Smittium megazygosporum]
MVSGTMLPETEISTQVDSGAKEQEAPVALVEGSSRQKPAILSSEKKLKESSTDPAVSEPKSTPNSIKNLTTPAESSKLEGADRQNLGTKENGKENFATKDHQKAVLEENENQKSENSSETHPSQLEDLESKNLENRQEQETFHSRYRYVEATQSDIVRSSQKDKYYTSYIENELLELVNLVFGVRFLMRYKARITKSARLMYLLLTTIKGLPTLGEEYVGIMQFDHGKSEYPSSIKRTFYALCSVFGRDLVMKTAKLFKTSALLNSKINDGMNIAQKFHLGIFYLFGSFYEISKRIFGIRYMKLRELMQGELQSGYEVLGVLMMVQFAVAGARGLKSAFDAAKKFTQSSKNTDDNSTFLPTGIQSTASGDSRIEEKTTTDEMEFCELVCKSEISCDLCLSPITNPTATPCGHVFCWKCIYEWLFTNTSCPFCRQSIKQSHILPIYGYG